MGCLHLFDHPLCQPGTGFTGEGHDVQITHLTAFPGTPLLDRLLAEGRVIEPARWDLCTLFDVNFQPRRMSVPELREGMYRLSEALYEAKAIERRRAPFFEALRRRGGRRGRRVAAPDRRAS